MWFILYRIHKQSYFSGSGKSWKFREIYAFKSKFMASMYEGGWRDWVAFMVALLLFFLVTWMERDTKKTQKSMSEILWKFMKTLKAKI